MTTGINIATGTETYVGVKRIFTNKLDDKRFSDCLTELKSENVYSKQLFGYFKDLNVNYYDQNFCYTLCYQDKLINECRCCDIITPSIRNSNFCESESETECMDDFDKFFSTADLKQVCESACPQKCNSIEYELSVSTATFPTLSYLKNLQAVSDILPKNLSDSELKDFGREGMLKLIVNYDDLYYTSIDESQKKTFEGLIGELGGSLGLLIGLSVLSLIEIIDLFIKLINAYIEYKKSEVIPIAGLYF